MVQSTVPGPNSIFCLCPGPDAYDAAAQPWTEADPAAAQQHAGHGHAAKPVHPTKQYAGNVHVRRLIAFSAVEKCLICI